jgi:hypothetical protein
MKHAAFVCAVGNHLVEQIKEKAHIDRVIVTCMGVNTDDLRGLGQERAYVPGTIHVATVARLHAAKGHVHALAAVRQAHQSGLGNPLHHCRRWARTREYQIEDSRAWT